MTNFRCRPWLVPCLAFLLAGNAVTLRADDPPPQNAKMAGYLLVPHGPAPPSLSIGE
jgi:hypothetical protein